ncbi:uncharacterized protein FIBRA_07102 [Fibroporia radiculosa]|uniref:Uncharacterized protein n=1 Tax=Fibroporia radiculosa TaxID=599839 RepID=J4GUC6_9APHY|nr:uncharacterized protein FIBRA_07102 [Fibroporia radiculosa]CCM04905.1 predicted protein [Fibroporia radiculosa]
MKSLDGRYSPSEFNQDMVHQLIWLAVTASEIAPICVQLAHAIEVGRHVRLSSKKACKMMKGVRVAYDDGVEETSAAPVHECFGNERAGAWCSAIHLGCYFIEDLLPELE